MPPPHKAEPTETLGPLGPHRVQFSRACWFYTPDFVSTPTIWREYFRKRCSSIITSLEKTWTILPHHSDDEYILKIEIGTWQLALNADTNEIWLERCPNASFEDQRLEDDIGGDPDTFAQKCDSADARKRFGPELTSVVDFTNRLLESMHENFEIALETSKARIWARKQSVLAEFELISLDQWRCCILHHRDPVVGITEKDASNDEATTKTGERLYFVVVTPGQLPGPDSFKEKNAIEEAILRHFIGLMQDGPNQPITKKILFANMRKEFPDVKNESLKRCYTQAVKVTRASRWAGGRPSKKTSG